MDDINEKKSSFGESSSNEEFTNAGVIRIRLDTNPILNQLEAYLKGEQTKYIDTESGLIKEEVIQVAKPKANKQGVYSIMSWLRSSFNSQIVQGNFQKFDDLYLYLADYRMNLCEHIMINLHNWEMSESDFEGTIDLIMSMVEPFLSRLVNNEERKSFTNTIQHSERSDTQHDKKRFGFI